MTPTLTRPVNVVAIIRGNEQYVILYRDGLEADVVRQLGVWASEPELEFTWFNAAKAAREIREKARV